MKFKNTWLPEEKHIFKDLVLFCFVFKFYCSFHGGGKNTDMELAESFTGYVSLNKSLTSSVFLPGTW